MWSNLYLIYPTIFLEMIVTENTLFLYPPVVNKCCVPQCTSNYDEKRTKGTEAASRVEYVSIFQFPRDEELRRKWANKIPRKNWVPTKYSAVCSKHFCENDLMKCNGRIILRENAVPQLFPGSLILSVLTPSISVSSSRTNIRSM